MSRQRRIIAIISQIIAGSLGAMIFGFGFGNMIGAMLGISGIQRPHYTGEWLADFFHLLRVNSLEMIRIFILFPLISAFIVVMVGRFWGAKGSERPAVIGAWLGTVVAFALWFGAILLGRLSLALNPDFPADIWIGLALFMFFPSAVFSTIGYWRSVEQSINQPLP
jgi:hypothetical protein